LQNLDILPIDYARCECEKKGVSSAMSFMYSHTDKNDLILRISKIAGEELGHFE